MYRLVAVAFCFVGALANKEGGIKNTTAGGHYGGNMGYDPSTSYSGPAYENYGYGMYGYPLLPPVMEIVTEPSRHGHSRAVRVRCSEIANHDENSCSVCCQNSARRDKSIKKEDMFGFLAVTEDFEKDNSEDDEDNDRVKRSTGFSNTDENINVVPQVEWKASAHYTNVKCVCCSPTRPLPPRPAYPSPMYQAPQQVYQPPAQAQPQPVYQPPVQTQSAYQAPSQSQPVYQAPAHSQPNFQVPVQSSPKPYQPVVQAPGSQQATQQY